MTSKQFKPTTIFENDTNKQSIHHAGRSLSVYLNDQDRTGVEVPGLVRSGTTVFSKLPEILPRLSLKTSRPKQGSELST